MLNKVMILGNLGIDPDIRRTPAGEVVANFRMATNEKWKDKEGKDQERTEWHRIVVFGNLASICGQYLKKGSKVLIEGQLRTRKWTDKEGQEQYTTEVVVSGFGGKMIMLDSAPHSRPVPPFHDIDNDIPF